MPWRLDPEFVQALLPHRLTVLGTRDLDRPEELCKRGTYANGQGDLDDASSNGAPTGGA